MTWQTIGTLIVGGLLMIGEWKTPNAIEWGGMLLLGIVSCLAHLMIVRALKLAPAAMLAPLALHLLLWAVIFGWAFFGDVPGTRILVGSAIIVLAGLFIFHRQKRGDRAARERAEGRQLTFRRRLPLAHGLDMARKVLRLHQLAAAWKRPSA